jgi:hypothetical protein
MSITWSYSGLGLFQQCPRKYYHLRVIKDIVEPKTDAITYGEMVHKAAEDYIGKGVPVPEKFAFITPVLDVLKEIPGTKHCEYKMGLTEELDPCGFFDKNVWYRGIADLLIINDQVAHIIDYKTGKSAQYADTKQLELMALSIFKHFPQVKKVKSGLLFVIANDFVKADFKADDQGMHWMRWLEDTARLEKSIELGIWNPRPNFSCKGWCAVKDCIHNGKGSYR